MYGHSASGNATDPSITGPGKEEDFSFSASGDSDEVSVAPGPDGASVDFYGKDYGGVALVQVTLKNPEFRVHARAGYSTDN